MDQADILLQMMGKSEQTPEQPAPPPPPAQPKRAAPSPPRNRISGVDKLLTDTNRKSLDQLVADVESELGTQETPKDERGFFSKIMSGVGDAFVQTARDVTVLKRELMGESIDDVPEPLTNDMTRSWVEDLGYAITKYGGAAVAGGLTLGPFGAIGAPLALVLAEDPRTVNVADVLKASEDTISEAVKGTPWEDIDAVVDAVSDTLAKEEGDSSFTKRLKNLGTDVATGAVIAPFLSAGKYAIGKVFKSAVKTSQKAAEKIAAKKGVPVDEVIEKAGKEEVVAATKEVIQETQPELVIKAGEGARVGKITMKKPSVIAASVDNKGIVPEEELARFEKGLGKELPPSSIKDDIVPDAVPTPKVNDESVVDRLSNVMVQFRDKFRDVRTLQKVKFGEVLKNARKSITDADRAKILRGEVESLDDIAKTLVMFEETAENYVQVISKEPTTPEQVLKVAEATNNMMYMAGIYSNTYTDVARKLGFGKMIEGLARAGDPRVMDFIGGVGKYRAVVNLIEKHGGAEAIKNQADLFREVMIHATDAKDVFSVSANKLVKEGVISEEAMAKLIAESKQVLAESNAQYFMDKAGQVLKKSRGRTIAEGITSYLATNTLTVKSAFNAFIEFPTTSVLRGSSNYLKSIGWAVKGDPMEAKAALVEANIYAATWLSEVSTALKKSARTIVEGKADPNERFIQGPNALPPDVAFNVNEAMPFERLVKKGTMMERLVPVYGWSIGLGRRLLIGLDVGVSHIGYESHVKSKIAADGVRRGLKGDELFTFIDTQMKDVPDKIHDAAVLEARKYAYNAEPEMAINKAIEAGMNKAPAVRMFNLFFRAKANSIERTLEYFPGAGFLLQSQRAALRSGDKQLMADVFAKQATGGMLLGLSYAAAELGYTSPYVPKDVNKFDYWSPNFEKQMSEGMEPNSIKVGGTQIKLPIGSPMEKIFKIGGILHWIINRDSDDGAVESAVELAQGALVTILDDPGRYQSDLEFLGSVINNDLSKEDLGRFASNKLMQVLPMANTINLLSGAWNDPYMKDLRGYSDDPLDYTIDMLENRVKSVISSEGLVVRRNILGEPIFRATGFAGLSVFNTPMSNADPTMEKLAALEEYSMLHKNTGVSALSLTLPPRTAQIQLDDVSGKAVLLPPRLYEKLLDYYRGVDTLTGLPITGSSLRDLVTDAVDSAWEMYKADPRPEIMSLGVAEIKKIFNDTKSYAMDALKADPEYISWVLDKRKQLSEAREKIPQMDQQSTQKKINLMMRSR